MKEPRNAEFTAFLGLFSYNYVYNINEHDTQLSCYRWYDKSGSESDMKIDRLIGILSVLLQEKKVTAPELAKIFEVSRRTINRDIEDLCRSGIPIFTSQGAGGGISIMDGYKMERTILSSKDMQMIMAGLRSLDSVSGSHYYV